MPTVKSGDRITLKPGRLPLANQVPEWGDDRAFKPFDDDQVFTVLAVKGSKVELEAYDHFETRSFTWFKNAIAKVQSADASESVNTASSEPAKPSVDDDWDAPDPMLVNDREVQRTRRTTLSSGVTVELDDRQKPVWFPKTPEELQKESEPKPKTIKFPATQAEFATGIAPYKGCSYWVEGRHAKGKTPAEYYYCIQRNGTVTKSDVPYDSVYYAGRWAREAIDKLADLEGVAS